jgi:undecaprenyl-diphosphatase
MTAGHASESGRPGRPRASAWRERLRLALAVLLTLAALAVLGWQVQRAGPINVVERLLAASPAWLLLALILTAGRFLAFAVRLAAITRRLVACSTASFVPIVFASQFVSLVLPGLRAGSAYLRAHLAAKRFAGGTALHLGPNIVDQVGSAVAWLLSAVALLPWAVRSGDGPLPRQIALAAGGMLLLLLIAGSLLRRYGPRLVGWLDAPRDGRRGTLARAGSRALHGTGKLAFDPAANLAALLGGFAFIACTGGAQYATLAAVGAPAPLWLAVLAVTVGGAAGTIAHTPGGLGVTEAAQVAFLSSQGVSAEAATSAVLLARILNYAFVALAGGSALAREWNAGRMRGLFGGGETPAPPPGEITPTASP